MSKTVELARHLETLHINNMYKNDFYWTWDKTDEEIDAVFTVADALRDLRERNKNTKVFNSGLGISIFRDNSTRTRFSFASACNLLGLEEQVLDEKVSQIAHGETVRETANMVSFMADVIGIRDDMYIGQGHTYQKTFMDALDRAAQAIPAVIAHRHADDPIHHLVARLLRRANPHLDAGEAVTTQMLNDILQPVVPPGGAEGTQPELAHRQVDVIGYHEDMLRRDLIEAGGGAYGLPGEIHVGLGLHHQHLILSQLPFRRPGLEAQLVKAQLFPLRQPVNG